AASGCVAVENSDFRGESVATVSILETTRYGVEFHGAPRGAVTRGENPNGAFVMNRHVLALGIADRRVDVVREARNARDSRFAVPKFIKLVATSYALDGLAKTDGFSGDIGRQTGLGIFLLHVGKST